MDTKKKLAVGAAAAVLALGGGAAIAAQSPAGTTGAGEARQDEQDPSIKGSVAAPAGKDAEKNESEEAGDKSGKDAAEEGRKDAEDRQLSGLAQVDRKTAERAALQAVPGAVKDAELGDENGYVVWEVGVAARDGKLHEVKVDAGNGRILAREADGDENGADKGSEGSEANEPAETSGK